MSINPNFNLANSYFECLPQIHHSKPLYSKIMSILSFALERLSQLIHGVTNEKMWEISKQKLDANIKGSLYNRTTPIPAFSEKFFLFLAKKKFTNILQKGAILYFQKKIDSGDETLESLKEKLKSRGRDVKEIVENAKNKDIISILSLSELSMFLNGNPLGEELDGFFYDIKYYFEFPIVTLQDRCEKKFLELFSRKELVAEGSWKFCLAKRLVKIQSENLPQFAKEKLAKAREFLPDGFDEKVRIWEQSQDFAKKVVDRKIDLVKARIFEGFEIPPTLRISKQELQASHIVEKVASEQAYKYTELMPTRPADDQSDAFMLSYLTRIIELCILQECALKYQGKVSEEDFLDAYQNWDKFGMDPVELEKLLEEKIAQAKLA